MIDGEQRKYLLDKIGLSLRDASDIGKAADTAVGCIFESLDRYCWVGVYWLDGDELVLGPYRGADTDHKRIPVGRGVCGMAVAEDRNQLIDDVRKLDNYLACSIDTRSEIVVLIRDNEGAILGQIDVDGHSKGDFDESDEGFLREVAAMLAEKSGR